MKIDIKKLLKKILIIILIVYAIIILINQQKQLNTYSESIAATEEKIEEANEHKDSLISLKQSTSSLEYIEKIAREKLNMYKPNEKVYIDVGS